MLIMTKQEKLLISTAETQVLFKKVTWTVNNGTSYQFG
uniref:Uncharacterized protein n=1 Tax=Arundo donax TaxID=35708 RepID=A0A0A9FM10_ARUDO